jgi:hypothetical protein
MSDQPIPESRTYRHTQCGNETEIGGDAFEVASNPLSTMETTQCSTCGAQFPIADFAWVDTDESIADSYARHSEGATDMQRFLCSKRLMFSMIAIRAVLVAIGFFVLVRDEEGIVKALCTGTGLVVGAVAGGALFEKVLEKPITRKVCGVKDTRLLK